MPTWKFKAKNTIDVGKCKTYCSLSICLTSPSDMQLLDRGCLWEVFLALWSLESLIFYCDGFPFSIHRLIKMPAKVQARHGSFVFSCSVPTTCSKVIHLLSHSPRPNTFGHCAAARHVGILSHCFILPRLSCGRGLRASHFDEKASTRTQHHGDYLVAYTTL